MGGTGWPALRGAAAAGATVAAGTAAIGTYAAGFRYGGNSPVLVVPLAAAALTCHFAATDLARGGERRVGRRVAATGAALFGYLLLTAVAAEYAGARRHDDAAARIVTALHAAGYILPITLMQLCFLAAGERLGPRRPRWEGAMLGYVAAYALLAVLTLPAGEPYGHIAPLWASPAAAAVAGAAALPWMATVLAGPVVLWRAVPAARGAARHRLLVTAVVSMVPITTILLCVLAGLMAFSAGVLSVPAGEAALAVAFCLPFVLCPLGLAAVLRPRGAALVRLLAPALSVLLGTLFAIVAAAAGAIAGDRLGAGAVLPVVLATLAVAALLAPIRRRLTRALVLRADPVRARTARLVREAEAGDGLRWPAETVQRILRTALDDPAARLALRLPEGGWAYADGSAAPEPPPDAVPIGTDGYLQYAGEAVDAEGGIAEIRVPARQAALELAVREQAGRAEAAAAGERRRLERDLHDGVQGRLLALALELRMAQRELADAQAQLVLTDAAERLAAAMDELRSLATGNAPETLSRHGLRTALGELTGAMPVPVRLSVPAERLPPQVETVAYLVVCEAVTNALKHAGARAITVDVTAGGGRAEVTVTDDGRGGADLRAGTGLRGLAERVGAAGGRLVVSDRRPHGTVLEVVLPCES
ncbi:histidine kinase [Spirillospora sp. NPDC029432]|uniref:sensor histidine kinase n=1 Tax=Spirillospora sp. NPDC029432 TaxID=3154599 RepID=UPI0034538A84